MQGNPNSTTVTQYVKDKSREQSNKTMSATNEFRITQVIDNGQMIQLALIENISTEPVSQQQMIIDSVAKNLDSDTKEQVMPLLQAILQAQPKINIKSYQQTQMTVTMPRTRYDNMQRPQVGDIIATDLKKI